VYQSIIFSNIRRCPFENSSQMAHMLRLLSPVARSNPLLYESLFDNPIPVRDITIYMKGIKQKLLGAGVIESALAKVGK
jgi:hypothetical protein